MRKLLKSIYNHFTAKDYGKVPQSLSYQLVYRISTVDSPSFAGETVAGS